MKKILFLVLVTIITVPVQAQKEGQERIDSLLTELPKAKEDTNKVKLLLALSFAYSDINPAPGIKYAKEALVLALQLNWKKGIALAAANIGTLYDAKSDYAKALEYYFMSLKINEELEDSKMIADCFLNIGTIYDKKENYTKALEYYFKALGTYEHLGEKAMMARSLGNIGITYSEQENYVKALEYFMMTLKINEELGNKGTIARSYGNIGRCYFDQREYSKALEYYFKALKINNETGNRILKGSNLGNIGETYLTISNDSSKVNLNRIFSGKKKEALQQALVYTDSAITIKKDLGELKWLSDLYETKSRIESSMGNDKGALESYKLYTTYRDSIFNLEIDKEITQTAMQYEFDKKEAATKAEQEKKDVIIQKELLKQKLIRNGSIGVLALVMLLLFFVYRNYSNQRRANKILRETQAKLIQSEKMAAFGVMASRVSHEIQNPLNFVNNFSAISQHVLKDVISADSEDAKKEAAQILMDNLQIINHHGKRADSIVKQLQEHTRAGTAGEFFEGEKK